MKTIQPLLFLFALLLIVSACGGDSGFISADRDEVGQSSTRQERRQSRSSVDRGPAGAGTSVRVGLTVSDLDDLTEADLGTTRGTNKGRKVDFLFYMDTVKSSCVYNLKRQAEKSNWLFKLNKSYNWQMSFAYHSHTGKLLALEKKPGKAYKKIIKDHWLIPDTANDYTLSKGEYPLELTQAMFHNALSPVYRHHFVVNSGKGSYDKLPGNLDAFGGINGWHAGNPLKGLKHILNGKSQRPGAHTVVIFLSRDRFPYYTHEQWATALSGLNVSIIAMGWHTTDISNIKHVLDKKDSLFRLNTSCNLNDWF